MDDNCLYKLQTSVHFIQKQPIFIFWKTTPGMAVKYAQLTPTAGKSLQRKFHFFNINIKTDRRRYLTYC